MLFRSLATPRAPNTPAGNPSTPRTSSVAEAVSASLNDSVHATQISGWRPSHISLFRRETGVGDPRAHLLDQDVIYVGGGSMVSLMGTWQAHGIDRILREAWQSGVVLCGGSAGALCWFTSALSGFHEGPARALTGLGLLPASLAVHYHEEPGRRQGYLDAVAAGMVPGYGAGDSAALHFVGTEFVEAVSSRQQARAAFVGRDRRGAVSEQELAVRFLGTRAELVREAVAA